jgi:hypothetical protein
MRRAVRTFPCLLVLPVPVAWAPGQQAGAVRCFGAGAGRPLPLARRALRGPALQPETVKDGGG